MAPTRRTVLRTCGAGLTGLAGCLGDLPGSDGSAPSGLALESLDVGGSPGGQVGVNPPDTVTLLDFFATWCAPCKPQMESLGAVRASYGDELAMRSVTNESDRGAVRSFWKQYDGTWPVLLDPGAEATQAYSARRVPTLIVLDDAGEEVWRHTGLAARDDVEDAIQRAL